MSWLNDSKNLSRNECTLCLVGNKSDLNNREVAYEEGAKFAQENNILFYECSALSGENIEEIFNSITKNIVNKIENGIIDPYSVMSIGFKKIKEENGKNGLNTYCNTSC